MRPKPKPQKYQCTGLPQGLSTMLLQGEHWRRPVLGLSGAKRAEWAEVLIIFACPSLPLLASLINVNKIASWTNQLVPVVSLNTTTFQSWNIRLNLIIFESYIYFRIHLVANALKLKLQHFCETLHFLWNTTTFLFLFVWIRIHFFFLTAHNRQFWCFRWRWHPKHFHLQAPSMRCS